jgi:CheY-like chemotaxis protein
MEATLSFRVCLVEDDADTLESSARLLRVLGHQILAASSGEMALAQAPAWKPDVMLIDLAMPSLDGCELARQLRSQAAFGETPLIAVSGYVDSKHRQQASEAGFDDFLGKPYSLGDLQSLFLRIETRIVESRMRIAQSRAASAASRSLNERARSGLIRPAQ